jgi:hypothetical protein
MYYPNNPTIIESVDIMRVLTDGTVQDLSDGTQALTVQLVIRPESGKRYAPGSFPLAIHLTDGVTYRTLAFEPIPESPRVSHESSADAQTPAVSAADPPALDATGSVAPETPEPVPTGPVQTTENTTTAERMEPIQVLNAPSTETH